MTIQPATQPSFTSKILAAVSGKTVTATDRSQAVKTPPTGTKLLGARAKESSQPPSPQPSISTSTKLKKSSSFRGGEREEDGGSSRGSKSDPKSSDSLSSLAKSPKLSRTESMTERTVQKITKVIRGTSRSESRSKKNRDSSLSPKGGSSSFVKDAVDLKEDQKVAKKTETGEKSKKTAKEKDSSGDNNKKDDKKSAVEKRKEFQSHKNPS